MSTEQTHDPLALAHHLAAGGVPDAAALTWLQVGFKRLLSGEVDSLELGLRLTGAARIATRNRCLREAAHLIDNGRNLSAHSLAGKLSAAIKRYEARASRLADEQLGEIDKAIRAALSAGAVTMRSQRRLHGVLKD
jgi:hypothetical protein